jgi:AraC-like DNA-binding protein
MKLYYPDLYQNVRHSRSYMDNNCHLPLDLADISSRSNFSRYHFIRVFRRVYRQTPHQYLMQKRINKAICFEIGFQSLGSFSSLFYKKVGQSPTEYREKYRARKNAPSKAIPYCYSYMFGIPQGKEKGGRNEE